MKRLIDEISIETVEPVKQGGQHVGMMPTGVRITHNPTGITACCQCERSQMKNRNVAMSMIEYGLAEIGWENLK